MTAHIYLFTILPSGMDSKWKMPWQAKIPVNFTSEIREPFEGTTYNRPLRYLSLSISIQ